MELGGGMDGFHESDKFLETGRQTYTLTAHSTFLTVGFSLDRQTEFSPNSNYFSLSYTGVVAYSNFLTVHPYRTELSENIFSNSATGLKREFFN